MKFCGLHCCGPALLAGWLGALMHLIRHLVRRYQSVLLTHVLHLQLAWWLPAVIPKPLVKPLVACRLHACTAAHVSRPSRPVPSFFQYLSIFVCRLNALVQQLMRFGPPHLESLHSCSVGGSSSITSSSSRGDALQEGGTGASSSSTNSRKSRSRDGSTHSRGSAQSIRGEQLPDGGGSSSRDDQGSHLSLAPTSSKPFHAVDGQASTATCISNGSSNSGRGREGKQPPVIVFVSSVALDEAVQPLERWARLLAMKKNHN